MDPIFGSTYRFTYSDQILYGDLTRSVGDGELSSFYSFTQKPVAERALKSQKLRPVCSYRLN